MHLGYLYANQQQMISDILTAALTDFIKKQILLTTVTDMQTKTITYCGKFTIFMHLASNLSCDV